MLVLLILVLSASAGHGAALNAPVIDLVQFDDWTSPGEPLPGSWACCDTTCWPGFAELPAGCPGLEDSDSIDGQLSAEFRDRDGLKRDTYYFLGYQVAAIGVLYLMPESISSWDDEDKDDYSFSKWWDNISHPAWDKDDFFLNYVTHPYWGAAYFVRARERGYTNTGSFWYSVLLSSIYEYGVEALFEPVSVQDIMVTPVFGSLLGGYFMNVREDIRDRSNARGYRNTGDKWLWVLTDPLGAINGQIDSWIGYEADFQIRPYIRLDRRVRVSTAGGVEWQSDDAFGVTVSLRW